MRWLALATGLAFSFMLSAAAYADAETGLAEFRAGRFAEALRSWQRAAEAGDARGALFTGVLYDTGVGVPQDLAQALHWYRRGAEAGNATAAFNAAVMYDAGQGTPADHATAVLWYERAAAAGFPRADYNLAMMYEAGIGVAQDRGHAVTLYRSAASHGISAARAHLAALGHAYAEPAHGAQDASVRNAGVQDAAMVDFRRAQQMLLSRGPGDVAAATQLFRRAADQHNALAEYDLGYCYEHGMGVPQDRAEAYAWYRRAADHADSDEIRAIAVAGAQNLEGRISQVQPRHAVAGGASAE